VTIEPIGDICVLREERGNDWTVTICRGQGTRQRIRSFPTREQAAEFACAERDRYRRYRGLELAIHFPDDCPCHCLETVHRPG